MNDIDTMNRFFVGARGERIAVLGVATHDFSNLSKDDALNLAAWLVALANEDGKFERLLSAVMAT